MRRRIGVDLTLPPVAKNRGKIRASQGIAMALQNHGTQRFRYCALCYCRSLSSAPCMVSASIIILLTMLTAFRIVTGKLREAL